MLLIILVYSRYVRNYSIILYGNYMYVIIKLAIENRYEHLFSKRRLKATRDDDSVKIINIPTCYI